MEKLSSGRGSVLATCGKHCGKSQSGETIADCGRIWRQSVDEPDVDLSPL